MGQSTNTNFINTINSISLRNHLLLIKLHTGLEAEYVLIFLLISLLFISLGFFDFYLTNFIGLFYPVCWSIRAIENKDINEDKQWLTYWIIFSTLSLVDLFRSFILCFIPYYFVFKFIFLLWLLLPNTKGSMKIYSNIILKYLKVKKVEKEKM